MTYIASAVLALSTAWLLYRISVRKWASQTTSQGEVMAHDRTREVAPRKEDRKTAKRSNRTSENSSSIGISRDVSSNCAPEGIPSFTLTNTGDSKDADGIGAAKQNQVPDLSSHTLPMTGNLKLVPTPISAPVPSAPALTPAPRLKPPTFTQSPNRMPPPPRPSGGSLRPSLSPAAGLRAPPKPLLLSASTLPANGQPSSRAVVLSPGHSPLDWASLTHNPSASRTLRGHGACGISMKLFSSPHTFLRIPPSTLRRYNGRKGRDAWTSYNGKVYNITAYLPFHPGGEPEILKGAGRASDKLFAEIHPWVNWDGMLSECCIGILVGEDDDRAIKVDREGKLIDEGTVGHANHLDEPD